MWLLPALALALPSPIPVGDGACEVFDLDEELCSCTDLAGQKVILDCEVPIKISALNFTDSFGVKVSADPCADPASLTVDVVERAFGIDVPLKTIVVGSKILEPIPGLAINVPDVGYASVDIDIEFHGDIDELTVKAGLTACIKSQGEEVCGEDIPYLKDLLPIWLIDGTYNFGHVCANGQLAEDDLIEDENEDDHDDAENDLIEDDLIEEEDDYEDDLEDESWYDEEVGAREGLDDELEGGEDEDE
mmetsp:Transcript_2990/g.8718  ORF Transcript_2990/g.8718 Transcript_2990/m.8718 type:complete len:247 (+) Transcript_2990:61-801(+)